MERIFDIVVLVGVALVSLAFAWVQFDWVLYAGFELAIEEVIFGVAGIVLGTVALGGARHAQMW